MDTNAYERWTKEETERLIEAYEVHEKGVYDLANEFGRTLGTIATHLVRSGCIECKSEVRRISKIKQKYNQKRPQMGLTEEELIIRCKSYAREIMKKLGKNMSESVYHNACIVKLKCDNVAYKTEYNIPIIFEEVRIGTMRCDLLVDERVVLELKAKEKINHYDKEQLRKYMRFLGVKRGLLINFKKGLKGGLQFVTINHF